LQNEKSNITVEQKVELINRLSKTGLAHIESASFVSPKWVPQMASSDLVMKDIEKKEGIIYSALTPNMRGFENAIASGCKQVAVFAAASEGFSQKNINCSISESIKRFEPIIEAAKSHNIPVRGYVSCVIACPYDGETEPSQVSTLTKEILDMGCYEVSLGDTIGVGTPLKTAKMLEACLQDSSNSQLAGHFHDTYGQALANVLIAMQMGISTFDSSVAGLGGCPYAKGASGNLASEDLVYMLENMGINTGVDLSSLCQTGNWISALLNRTNASKVGLAVTK
jgi:hydroxymethylglutaryl-CoA lyase